jgi:hypothetical protein
MSGGRGGVCAGLLYGALAFLAGAVLGPARELALAPRLGGMAAALIEAAAMAVLLWCAARLVLARVLEDAAGWRARAVMSAVALAVVLAAEAALGWALAASGLAAQRAPRSTAEQAVGLPLLAWLVALPFLPRGSRGRG